MKVTHFDDWRTKARSLLQLNVLPAEVIWSGENVTQTDLFAEALTLPENVQSTQFMIPKEFMKLAQIIAYHRSIDKWDMLYQLLWRLTHGEKQLLSISTDRLVYSLLLMAKAIKRDAHKMKAFVRFCKFTDELQQDTYLAWYKPDHLILRHVAPFFQRRFEVMLWTIMTPDETVHWNGKELLFSEGKTLTENPSDSLEQLWQTYYRAIFNPARIKIKAMKREMPVRYWHNMPETKMIPALLAEAPMRVEHMMQHQEGLSSSAAEYLPENLSISKLRDFASNCQGCSLYKNATQTVFGSGNPHAKLLIVGEQPGDQEDLSGQPFVGPAGTLLRTVLDKLEIDAKTIYITNAVKHFKFVRVKNLREHRSPSVHEINACKPWVAAEIVAVQPKVVLCLGLTAAKSLISPGFHIKQDRGKLIAQENYIITATYHPAAILRTKDSAMSHEMMSVFEKDLAEAYQLAIK